MIPHGRGLHGTTVEAELCSSSEQGLTGDILIVHSEPYLLKNISPVGAESVMISLFNRPQSSNSSFSNQIIVCVSFRVARCFEL